MGVVIAAVCLLASIGIGKFIHAGGAWDDQDGGSTPHGEGTAWHKL